MEKLRPVIYLCLILFIATTCRKGSGDPFISLKSRKERLVGDWNFISGQAKYTLGHQHVDYALSSSKVAVKGYKSEPYRLKLSIKEDYTFELTEEFLGESMIASGTWHFNTGVGESKKREKVFFKLTDVKQGEIFGHYFFYQNSSTFCYELNTLKSEELSLYAEGLTTSFSSGKDLKYVVFFKFTQPKK